MAGKKSGGDGDVLTELRVATKGLLYPSESDKPVKAFVWEGAAPNGDVDTTALRARVKAPDGAVVNAMPLGHFFEPVAAEQDWFGDEEKEAAQRFRALQQVLQDNLAGVQAFRVEGVHDNPSLVDVYVVGRTKEGDLAGVSTQLVET